MSILQGTSDQLQSITSGNTVLDDLANKYVVKPQTAQGISGFVFDYEGDTDVTWGADITDHYLEDNTPVNDHIAVHPLRVVLHGFVSELVLKGQQGILGALATIQNRLTAVPAYLGKYTPGTVQKAQSLVTAATNTVNKIDQAASRLNNVLSFFTAPGQSAQTRAYNKLLALANTRQVMVIQTPYKTLDRMAIENVRFVQPQDTKDWSDIVVTLKQLRFVTLTTTLDINANRNMQMKQPAANSGTTAGTPTPISVLEKGAGALSNIFGVK